MAIPSEADLAAQIVTDFKDVSTEFTDQGSDVWDLVEAGLALALARAMLRLVDELELTVVAGEMTGTDSAGDTPDSLTGPVVIE